MSVRTPPGVAARFSWRCCSALPPARALRPGRGRCARCAPSWQPALVLGRESVAASLADSRSTPAAMRRIVHSFDGSRHLRMELLESGTRHRQFGART